ncbi:MAG: sensor domain-containing diguanylate cyclase [Thermoanaerobaculia bacterium]
MINTHSLAPPDLLRFLERQKASVALTNEIDLDIVLRQVLQRAWEFVPSESGSILLDDPVNKTARREQNELVFVATFGEGSGNLIGQRLSGNEGIAGKVYESGTPYLSPDVRRDRHFYPDIDEQIGYQTHSIVCVPVYIGKHVCGVLELINRSDGRVFTERDMTLLEIFAGYTSFMLQNALDARRAQELARRDDLTGLYNDRWFHVCLDQSVCDADRSGNGFVLMFMDLDHFKDVNDHHGHLAGSQVLRETGLLLKREFVDADAIISRYGGDEFVMILHDGLEAGLVAAERIRESIAGNTFLSTEYGFGLPPLFLRGVVSASIGVAFYDPGKDSGSSEQKKNDLLRLADTAMYQAKNDGRNQVYVADARMPFPAPKAGSSRR